MTPQLATRLTIHPAEAGTEVALRDPFVSLPARRFPQIDGSQRALPARLRRETLHRRLLGASDILAATIAFIAVTVGLGHEQPNLLAFVGMPLLVLQFKLAGLYDRDQLRIVRSTLDEAPLLLQLTGLFALVTTILAPVILGRPLGALAAGLLWLATFVAVVGCRKLARLLAGRAVAIERCLVIGRVEQAERVRDKLRSARARAEVVATLPLADDEIAWLDPAGLRHLASELGVHRIIITPSTAEGSAVVELIRLAKAAGVQVSVLPRMLEVVGSAVEFEDVDGMTVLGVRPFGLSRSSRLIKRAFDLVATGLGLLAVAPVIAVIAAAIRLDSRGPIFFRQVRVGRDGRHFRIYKFRSMVVDADQRKDELRALNEVGDGMFKIARDPRVTRIGSLLRKTSLDELPQLFNVVRGEMSLVGPRPLVLDEDAQVLGLDRSRLHLTPGMTGPWQILGARVPMREMVGIDYAYVASWSLWLDVKVLIRTAKHVLRGGNV
jgi:exopolysaccharide biosynthesis polyprenyl glycosylphosphotransferase